MSYTVVGGGLGGLATAFYLRKLPGTQRVILVEASNRIGGWIQTTRHDDGVIYEHGPRTVRPAGKLLTEFPRLCDPYIFFITYCLYLILLQLGLVGANTLSVVEELGLSDNILSVDKSHPAATVRCILAGGELHILPSNLKSLFRKIPPFSKPLALAALQDWRAPQKVIDDESVHEFVSRRLGEDVADFAVDPMIRGICSGDSREISAKAFVLGPLFKMEQESGGIVKAMLKKMFKQSDQSEPEPSSELVKKARGENWSVWSLENGLEQFPEVLRNRLEQDGIEFELGSPVERIVSDDKKEKGLTIVTNKSAFQSDHVFLTTPAFASSMMTESLNFYLSKTLASIPYVTVAVINIEYPGKVQPLDAFGFLVPSNQRVPILGAVFDTCCFR